MKRGQLRVYLGAAPGAGKTYAMLGEGHRRLARGTDVVVGFAETYDRKLTAQLLGGLEIVPRRVIAYRHSAFEEMDLDAVLARKPEVALVDELAHTNIPGSRNAKRWQDVEELLAAGINVISTANIQHLESVNDVMEKITRRAATGDRPGRRRPCRRAGRDGRHDAGGAAAPDGTRQRLCGREGRCGAVQLFPCR
jgi:two-component system, OmpR family, sensor histidine kinase KdpD